MSESACFLTGEELFEQLYFVVTFGHLIAAYLGNTGRERPALALYHECVKVLEFFPPGDFSEALMCTTYQAISTLCNSVDDLKEAIKYSEMSIAIQEAIRDTFPDLCTWPTYSALGYLYIKYGNFKKGFEALEQALALAEDSDDRANICHNLSQLHIVLGNRQKAEEYLKIVAEDKEKSGATKDTGFDHLLTKGMHYEFSGNPKNAIPCFEQALKISRKLKDKEAEGIICSRLGGAYQDMKNLKQALAYYEMSLVLAKELGYKDAQQVLCYQIALLTTNSAHHADAGKASEHLQMGFSFSEQLQDFYGKLLSPFTKGSISLMSDDHKQAIAAFEEALKHCEEMEALTETEDELRISLGDNFCHVYSFLSRALLADDQNKIALVVADRGKSRALAALMRSKYGIHNSSMYLHKALSIPEVSQMLGKGTRLLITSLIEPMVCVWFLVPNGDIRWHYIVPIEEGKVSDYVTSVVNKSHHQIIVQKPDARCEDRSLPGLDRKQDEPNPEQPHSVPKSNAGLQWETMGNILPKSFARNKKRWNGKGPPLTILHNLMVTPVANLLAKTNGGDNPEELVFAPDGPLCLAPFAAIQDTSGASLIDKFRIRVIPSLATMLQILRSPADYHSNTGALIVGDPSVGKVQYKGEMHHIGELPFAKQEAEMIGKILNVEPLTGDKATKEEVLKKMGSVSLVHLAAHGNPERGEIALAPSPGARCGIIEEKEFLLSMADVLNAKLRAKLVVLSCCHSGRGDIKAEGVVGIARAFLAAGARSVLVSLWAIDDEATLYFMQHFYEGIVQGKSTSTALHQATKTMKNSETFNHIIIIAYA